MLVNRPQIITALLHHVLHGWIKIVTAIIWFCLHTLKYEANNNTVNFCAIHDDVIKWKHFPRYWPFVRGIHQSPVNSPLKGQWRGALMFSVICAWINGWVNNGEARDLRRQNAHYDVIVMHIVASIVKVNKNIDMVIMIFFSKTVTIDTTSWLCEFKSMG